MVTCESVRLDECQCKRGGVMKKWLWVILIMILLATVAACGNDNEALAVQEAVEKNERVKDMPVPGWEPESEFDNTYPLTGIGTDEAVNHRVQGVMIENSSSARPQSGLYLADVVYEVLSEGNITRLLAFYHSQEPERIGPVRSARDYYIHLNNGYDAVYTSAGGSPDAFSMMERGEVAFVNGLTYDGQFLERWSERSAPHNLYTSYEGLTGAAADMGYELEDRDTPELPFTEEQDVDGEEAEHVHVSYGSTQNNIDYAYDEEAGGYIRSAGGEQMNDLETGEPVTPRNVFIVEADHRVIDDVGRRDIDIESGGPAYLIQDGVAIRAEWQNVDGVILPYHDGEPLSFLPGQTFINFVQSGGGGIDAHVTIN